MDRIRYVLLDGTCCWTTCCRCMAGTHLWDQVAGHPYCPNCQEELALGEAPPLVERTEPRPCAVCARRGTVRFLTFPQNIRAGLEIDLCGEHLRGLLGRRLGPYAFTQLRRLLRNLSLETDAIFLLHGEFYNTDGHALRPAVEADAGGAEDLVGCGFAPNAKPQATFFSLHYQSFLQMFVQKLKRAFAVDDMPAGKELDRGPLR